jgi:hypothetical protein
MINITVIPKTKENVPYFRNEFQFDGDITKKYSCEVIGSNSPVPKIIGFITKSIGGIPQNFIVLEFEGRCNQTQATLQFITQAEVIEENKVVFMTWLFSHFTWFNFIFRLVSVATLKKIVKFMFYFMLGFLVAGVLYSTVEFAYEEYTGDDFDDTKVMQVWDSLTARNISKWINGDGIDKATELKEFLGDKAEDAIEYTTDKIDDIRD